MEALSQALSVADKVAEPQIEYEVRILTVPALHMNAVWLRAGEGGDLIVPYGRVPKGLSAGQAYREVDLVRLLRPAAFRARKFSANTGSAGKTVHKGDTMEDTILTATEVAVKLKVETEVVTEMLMAGRLKGVQVGSSWRVRERELFGLFEEEELVKSETNDQVRYILHGRIVTMNEQYEVLEDAFLAVKGARIAAVVSDRAALPAEFTQAPLVQTRSTLYPGLIDLHNHYNYNSQPLWAVLRRFTNRNQWRKTPEYYSQVKKPFDRVLKKYTSTSKAVALFSEVRAMLGGVTTGQGVRSRPAGLFRGLMRNLEEPIESFLPKVRGYVLDLDVTDPGKLKYFRRLQKQAIESDAAFVYHLAEGTDAASRQNFQNLIDHNLLNSHLVAIHALGLRASDLKRLKAVGANIVWSPLSNLLLYGETLNLNEVKAAGLPYCLGCDWTPSGSKNMLGELKIASLVNAAQGSPFSARELVEAVTVRPARSARWDKHIGKLEPGLLADLVAVRGTEGDPYQALLRARERDVELVMVGGRPRVGSPSLMKALRVKPDVKLERLKVGGVTRLLELSSEGSILNGLSLKSAVKTLKKAFSDLSGFEGKEADLHEKLLAFGHTTPQPFTLVSEFHEPEVDDELLKSSPWDMVDSLPFESIAVDLDEDAYWDKLANQTNLPDGLAEELRAFYT